MTKQYQIKNGTAYHPETPPEVVSWLETSRERNQPIRVFYGDTKTGKAWAEENDVWGVVGRSMGPVKVPLLCHPNSHGAPAMLEQCVVGIVTRGSDGKAWFVYRHPSLDLGVWTMSDKPQPKGNFWTVQHNGKAHAKFTTKAKAARYVAFMTGNRVAK